VEDDGQRQGQDQGEEHGSDGRAEAPCEPFSSGIHVDRRVCRYMNGRYRVVEEALQSVDRSKLTLAVPDRAAAFPQRGPNTHLPKPGAFPDTISTTLSPKNSYKPLPRIVLQEERNLGKPRVRSRSDQQST
jgi:hypothetical protein